MASILTLDGDGGVSPSHPWDDLLVDGGSMPSGLATPHSLTWLIYCRIENRSESG
ncbi:MAG TPA: hypothetical protein VNL13_07945 [Sulfolobales archaeon]|nr:hypothetical protein [Sulfolobales archaeon]